MTQTNVTPGDVLRFNGLELRVAEKCDGDSGYWLCVSHDMSFPNGLMLASHLAKRGEHVTAYFCTVHGIEPGE